MIGYWLGMWLLRSIERRNKKKWGCVCNCLSFMKNLKQDGLENKIPNKSLI